MRDHCLLAALSIPAGCSAGKDLSERDSVNPCMLTVSKHNSGNTGANKRLARLIYYHGVKALNLERL